MSTTIVLERLADILLEALDSDAPGATLVRVDLVPPDELELARSRSTSTPARHWPASTVRIVLRTPNRHGGPGGV